MGLGAIQVGVSEHRQRRVIMKRFFLAFALLAVGFLDTGAHRRFVPPPVAPPSGPALVAHIGKNGGISGGTSSAIDTTGANLIVVTVTWYIAGGATMSVSDSKSNTWTARTDYISGGAVSIQTFYCYSPTVGSGHTFTFSGTANSYSSATIAAFSGIAASPYDAENGTNYPSGTTAYQTGSVTPSQANTLIIAACGFDLGAGGPGGPAANISVNSGFTITDSVAYGYGTGEGNSMAYKVMTAATATNPTFTSDISAPGAANTTVFKY